jgi:type VI secretion system protein VasI
MNKTVMLASGCAALFLGIGGLMAEQAPPVKQAPPMEEVVPKDQTPPAKDISMWQVRRSVDPINDSETVALGLRAESEEDPRDLPVLFLRCANKKLEVYITWGAYLGSSATRVEVRFDSEPAMDAVWNISNNGTATFYLGPKIPFSDAKREAFTVAFIESMLKATRLTARVTPYRENRKVAVFKLYGLGDVIQPLWKSCGQADATRKSDAE